MGKDVEQKQPPTCRSAAVEEFKLVENALLGVLIEDVDSRNVKGQLDVVAGSGNGAGGNAGNEVLGRVRIQTVGGDVEVDLGTHQLGDVHVSVDDGVGHGADSNGLILQALGTDTHDNLLADVVGEGGILGLIGGKLDLVAAEDHVHVSALLLDLGVDEGRV